MGGARGDAARSGGGAVRRGGVRWSGGRPRAMGGSVAWAIGAEEEDHSSEVLAVHQGSKHTSKSMGS